MKLKFKKVNFDDAPNNMTWESEPLYSLGFTAPDGSRFQDDKFINHIKSIFNKFFPEVDFWFNELKYGDQLIVSFHNEEDEAQFIMLQNAGALDI
jgi:hypothetical protein